jgi:hypothetical protein
MSNENLTAYPQTEQACRDELIQATLNIDSFKQIRQRCSLSSCHGMCCNEGHKSMKKPLKLLKKSLKKKLSFLNLLVLTYQKK